MAVKGLDIFKLSPKTNCKECGSPTCMAFCMKVAQGAVTIDKCPHMSDEAKAFLGAATAPPMKSFEVGPYKVGGETVLFRHDKTFVSKPLYAVSTCAGCYDAKLAEVKKVSYDRIGEHMQAEFLNLTFSGDVDAYVELVKKASAEHPVILECSDVAAAKAALAACTSANTLLNGANAENLAEMAALAIETNAVLGVCGKDLDELYDNVVAAEKAGVKNIVIDATMDSIKDTYAAVIQIRRAAIKDKDRSFGYPSLVNVGKLASGCATKQTALAAMFTLKYGSIIVMEGMSYAQALPMFGLRQNIFTDPQKPMKVEPGIYALNGADENSPCVTTVDFALTYFVVSGELERSGVPVNLLISDAGGYSVLTAWAAGKLSAGSVAKFIKEYEIENKIKNRTLIIPGKVAVLKGEMEEKLPDWKIVVAPNEAVGLVKFMKEL